MSQNQQKSDIISKLQDNMILFGKVVMPNMFSAESPAFHYEIANTLVDKSDNQLNFAVKLLNG